MQHTITERVGKGKDATGYCSGCQKRVPVVFVPRLGGKTWAWKCANSVTLKRAAPSKKIKTPRAKVIQELDRLWARAVRERAGMTCEVCGRRVYAGRASGKESAHAHHMIPRSRSSFLRHRLENGVLLCRDCHDKFHRGEQAEHWKYYWTARTEDAKFITGPYPRPYRATPGDFDMARIALLAAIPTPLP